MKNFLSLIPSPDHVFGLHFYLDVLKIPFFWHFSEASGLSELYTTIEGVTQYNILSKKA